MSNIRQVSLFGSCFLDMLNGASYSAPPSCVTGSTSGMAVQGFSRGGYIVETAPLPYLYAAQTSVYSQYWAPG